MIIFGYRSAPPLIFKKLNTRAAIVLLLILSFSCKNNVDSTKTISINNFLDSVLLSKIVDTAFFLQLDSKDGRLASITNVYFSDSSIIVCDKKQKQVIIYKKNGEFYSKIYSIGKGPEEYATISDTYFNTQEGKFYIYDEVLEKMLAYNKWGIFTNEIDFHFYIGDFITTEEGFLCYNETTVNTIKDKLIFPGLLLIDHNGDLVQQVTVDNKGDRKLITLDNYFHLIKDTTFLTQWGTDTVYTIQNLKKIPCFVLKFPGHNLSEEYRNLPLNSRRMQEVVSSGMVYSKEPFIISSDFMFIRFYINQKPYYLFYWRSSGKYLVTQKIINDIELIPDKFNFITKKGEFLVGTSWSVKDIRGSSLTNNQYDYPKNPYILFLKLSDEI